MNDVAKPHSLRSTPLAYTTLKALVVDLVCDYELCHRFCNEGSKAIEAVYSFPIPLDAAFIGMQATLSGETLSARVLPAKQANRNYDQAITEGHSAVLLEQLEPGLLCVNLGNLKPGESGEIVLRFAAAFNVADGMARFSLPLVYRPRYGRSLLDEAVRPRNNFAVEHPLEAEIRISGLLLGCPVQCATQGVQFALEKGEMVLRIGRAMLDRDLVLNFDLGREPLTQARQIADGEDSLGILSFTVPHQPQTEEMPCDICLLLDCSGSMRGDAIVQSRAALDAVAGALNEQDRIQVIRFGSTASALFRRPLQATARVKDALRQLRNTIDANLGGTEMNAALIEGLQTLGLLDGDFRRKAIILVTDGAVHAHEIQQAKEQAMRQGIRIFVVAVGSSASVDALAPLSEATQATLERAVPAEPIDAGVMRQLRRAHTRPANVEIDWSGNVTDTLPLGIAYPGDAATAIARFSGQTPAVAKVRFAGQAPMQEFPLAPLQASVAWRAWAGQRAYLNAPPNSPEREAHALRYGLITEETKAVLVKLRDEADKADGLPQVIPVAHMVPEGMMMMDAEANVARTAHPLRIRSSKHVVMDGPPAGDMPDVCYYGPPPFLRRQADGESKPFSIKRPTLQLAAKSALAKALLDIALNGGKNAFDIDEILARIDSQWHKPVREYCKSYGLAYFSRKDAARLLYALLGVGVKIAISDENEAALALLRV
jgi:Ca-activated chloride channel family protein